MGPPLDRTDRQTEQTASMYVPVADPNFRGGVSSVHPSLRSATVVQSLFKTGQITYIHTNRQTDIHTNRQTTNTGNTIPFGKLTTE